jgi:Flp pilus assembly protein TadD
VAVFFALGLMSKPILVTLPFVLLLLDYWPLGRISNHAGADIHVCQKEHGISGRQECLPHRTTTWRLIAEKVPLLLLTAAWCAIAPWAQGTAVISMAKVPLGARVGNALVSYVDYVGETLSPENLAVFYPHPVDHLPAWKPTVALLALLCVTAAALVRWRRNPYFPVGWFWYLGMLVPTIGLVQIGSHAMADRYMYLPQIGLCLAATWGIKDVVRSWPNRAWACGAAAAVVIVALTAFAIQQRSYWHDSEALWKHTLECTSENNLAHTNLGGALAGNEQFGKAIEQYEAALRIDANDAKTYSLLGDALLHLDRPDEAIEQYETSVRIMPDSAEAQSHLGAALTHRRRFKEAVAHCEKALEVDPNSVDAHSNLGKALVGLGRLDDAIAEYETALRIAPDSDIIRHNLDVVRAMRARAKQTAE